MPPGSDRTVVRASVRAMASGLSVDDCYLARNCRLLVVAGLCRLNGHARVLVRAMLNAGFSSIGTVHVAYGYAVDLCITDCLMVRGAA